MSISELMKKTNLTRMELIRKSGIPESTLRGILNGNVQIERCEAGTLYRLARALETTVEAILFSDANACGDVENVSETLLGYYMFRRFMIRCLNAIGDLAFLSDTLAHDYVRKLYDGGKQLEAFYLLAMTDYLSRLHKLPLVLEYNVLRGKRVDCLVYPPEVASDTIFYGEMYRQMMCDKVDAIPEFLRHGLIETEDYIRLES